MLPYKRYFNLNPFFHIAAAYQEVLFFPGPFGAIKGLAVVGAASIVVFLAGYWTFDRLRDSFAEAV
jgi:ABC-type polysaccharide/polyol phosphate export permease